MRLDDYTNAKGNFFCGYDDNLTIGESLPDTLWEGRCIKRVTDEGGDGTHVIEEFEEVRDRREERVRIEDSLST